MSSAERWSVHVSDQEVAPVGSLKSLARAKKTLGPFKSEHLTELGQSCVCAECAEEQIRTLAIHFNRHRLLDKDAPRAADVVSDLDRVSLKSRELSEALFSLNDYARQRLQMTRKYQKWDHGAGATLFKKANAIDLPLPGSRTEPASDCLWIERLAALEQFARTMSDTFRQSRGIQEQKDLDKGGRTNLFKEQYGPPAWILVTGAWHTYNSFKPNQAVGSDGSSFHIFINQVHEYATGSSKENSTLQYWMTTLVKARRQNDHLLQKLSAFESRLDELQTDQKIDSDKAAEITELERQISVTRQAAIDLFPKLLPYASSRKKPREKVPPVVVPGTLRAGP
jgi:hypothetical protein